VEEEDQGGTGKLHVSWIVKMEELMYVGCRQQQVVSVLMSQPGFHLTCIDYLLGYDTPAAAAVTPNHTDDSFSFIACMLLCFAAFILYCFIMYSVCSSDAATLSFV